MTVTYRNTGVTYRDVDVTYRGGTPSDLPGAKVEIAFSSNPADASPVWVDVTDYVQSFNTRRGRNHELDRFETGTARVLLKNSDRRFDPTYTAGPYYGQLLPMKRIRITARWEGVTYPIFSGLVEGWPQEYTGGGFASYVDLPCADLFKSLALMRLNASYPEETSGARVGRVLDTLGWPAGERDLDTGQSTVQAAEFIGATSALAHLQDVAVSENGFLFIGRDGQVVFDDRHALIQATQDPSLIWGDDDSTEFPYTGISFAYDDSNLWNEVVVSADGLTSQVGEDTDSQAKYLTRTYPRSTVLADEDEMQDLANFIVSRFSEPAVRVVGMTMDGIGAFPEVLDREIGDKVRVNRRPQDVGSVLTQDSVVEGISVEVSQTGGWRFSWNLSPVDSVANYWVLGDASQSLLDTSTRLSY